MSIRHAARANRTAAAAEASKSHFSIIDQRHHRPVTYLPFDRVIVPSLKLEFHGSSFLVAFA